MRMTYNVYAILLFLSMPVLVQAQDPVQKWTLEDTFLVLTIEIDRTGRIYAVDADQHQVRIFDASGTFVRAVGREGKGPGELQNPFAIALGPEEERFAVRDRNRRVSFFARDGTYDDSFVLAKPILPTASMEFLSDSLLAIGGFIPESRYEGETIHKLTTDGERVGSFFPRPDKAKELKISVRVGSAFDLDRGGRINAVHYIDYSRLHVLSPRGEHVSVSEISLPSHFRAPTEPQPDPLEDRAGVNDWVKNVDSPRRLFMVGEDTVAVGVQEGGTVEEWTVDVIELERGHVLGSRAFKGFPVYVDAEDDLLYVATAEEEPATLLRAYRIDDFIE